MVSVKIIEMKNTLTISQYVQLNISFLEKLGFMRPRNLSNKRVYKIYTIIMNWTLCYSNLLTEMIDIFVQTDIQEASRILYMFMSKGLLLAKIYPIRRNMDRMLEMVYCNRPAFIPANEDQRKLFFDDIVLQRKRSLIFLGMGVLATLTKGFLPLIDPGRSGQLPYAGWYPFRIDAVPIRQIIFVYQIICTLYVCMADISLDTLISGLLMGAANQLQLLKNDILNMQTCSRGNFENKLYSNMDAGGNLNEKFTTKQLVKCVQRHRLTLEFAEEVTSLFSMPLFLQFVGSVVIIGLTMFQFILTPLFTLEFYSIAAYQSCILLEIFLFCYYGNEVMLQSKEITNALFHCGWEDRNSLEFRKNVIFFMTRTQMQTALYAGNFFILSLPTFISVLRSSWSYFALLHRIYGK